MAERGRSHLRYTTAIGNSGLGIYDDIEIGDPYLWIPSPELETLLNDGLEGNSVAGLPNRTRSKRVKEWICQILGYPTPHSFKRTQPRFPGQNFDVYVQKSNNLQIWNEEVSANRRYTIVRVDESDVITGVKVVTGNTLRRLDKTGTLTRKYQARLVVRELASELISPKDTPRLRPLVTAGLTFSNEISPSIDPVAGSILPIAEIYNRLLRLIGTKFPDAGYNQERNRGANLHRLVCEQLGFAYYHDDGRFPDVRHQLLEIKLQTSPTIDLGLVAPDNTDPLDVPPLGCHIIRNCDVRYAIFHAMTDGSDVGIRNLYVTTGAQLFDRFPRFEGNVVNRKLQIPLPSDFFSS